MDEEAVGCARSTGGPVGEAQEEVENTDKHETKKERAMLMVGQKVPDFTAPGYQKDKFVNVTLSDSIGKWVLLCFYPGDFTFV